MDKDSLIHFEPNQCEVEYCDGRLEIRVQFSEILKALKNNTTYVYLLCYIANDNRFVVHTVFLDEEKAESYSKLYQITASYYKWLIQKMQVS